MSDPDPDARPDPNADLSPNVVAMKRLIYKFVGGAWMLFVGLLALGFLGIWTWKTVWVVGAVAAAVIVALPLVLGGVVALNGSRNVAARRAAQDDE